MRHLTLSLLLSLLFITNLTAQADSTDTRVNEIFDIQNPPQFPGGQEALLQFLAETIMYPEAARNAVIEGVVAASFIVDRDGSIYDGKILKDIGGGCGEEVLRVLKLMPAWEPGTLNDKPIKVRYTLPVRFRLESNKESKKERRKRRKEERKKAKKRAKQADF